MSFNTFGKIFRFTTWGESHGPAIGCVVDGCPPNISFLTNKYINDEEPWKLKKNNIEKMNNILHIALEQIAKISILLHPIIPSWMTAPITLNFLPISLFRTIFAIAPAATLEAVSLADCLPPPR